MGKNSSRNIGGMSRECASAGSLDVCVVNFGNFRGCAGDYTSSSVYDLFKRCELFCSRVFLFQCDENMRCNMIKSYTLDCILRIC